MWTATWKSLLAHKLRLGLTALAVVLGVAFVTGTLMITDAMSRSFRDVITSTAGGVDVTVRGQAAFTGEFGFDSDRSPVPPDLLPAVAAVDGVRVADPAILGYAQLVDRHGDPIGGMGPPTLGANAPSEEGLGGLNVRDGRLPEREGEVALDAFTADQHDFGVGEQVTVLTQGPAETATVVGVVTFGEARNLAGATVTLFDLDTAVDRLSPDGTYTSIDVLASERTDLDELAARVKDAVGADYDVVTADELVEENLALVTGALGIFSAVLLVFAAVSLFVGAFIIFNTFSIIVAQRARELALLRAIGASRRQVLGSMLGEAAATGLFGSLVGIGAGALVALALSALMGAVGVELPTQDLALTPSAVLVGLVAGLSVTLVAALVPALRSTRVLPVAALQEVAAPPQARLGKGRYAVGALLTLAGAASLAAGMLAGAGLTAVLGGTALVFLGATVLSPLLVRPVVTVLGAPLARIAGVRGDLARQNSMRSPRRTASTAAALMIGLGLVGFVTILADSIKSSVTETIDEVFAADFQVRSASFATLLSPEVAERVAALPEVAIVGPQQFTEIRVDERSAFALASGARTLEVLMPLPMEQGSLADLDEGGVLISSRVAEDRGWGVGDEAVIEFSLTGTQRLPVRGVFDASGVDTHYILDTETYAENTRTRQDFAVLVGLHDGVDPEVARTAITAALADFPTANVTDQQGFRDEITGQINQLLALVYGLLFLSVVIALFGIVNTLALSVFERIRELGLLRAVGMTRRQVRSMVRWESVLVAVLGTVLGLGLGVFFAWITSFALADQGLTRFTIPVGQLLVAVVVAALAGVVAAIGPARKASRVDVLRAVTVE